MTDHLDTGTQIDTIVRFHDDRRLVELQRCVFSLMSQKVRPLTIILATQRFTGPQLETTEAAVRPLLAHDESVTLKIVNWEKAEPEDARSALLNMGLENAEGRYLGFLDYDDVLYPEAYDLLTSRLKESGAAIAFASVRIMQVDVYQKFLHATEEVIPGYRGTGLVDLFRNNFCPLHSYVIDRDQMSDDPIAFDNSMTMQEDYDFLLRFCARYVADFKLIATKIGDYYYKSDGSNTVPTAGGLRGEPLARLEAIQTAMEVRRRTSAVSIDVQRSLGIQDPDESATIRQVIDRVASGR